MTACPHTSDAANCWHCRPRPPAFDVGPTTDSLPAADRVPSVGGNEWWWRFPFEPTVCHDCGESGTRLGGHRACRFCSRMVCPPCRGRRHDLGASYVAPAEYRCLLGPDDLPPPAAV